MADNNIINNIPRPHGGELINRFVTTNKNLEGMFSIEVSNDIRNDIENIADGVFSPLEGFVREDDFQNILKSSHLKNGLAWTIPIVLDVDRQTAMEMKDAIQVALKNNNEYFGILYVDEVYSFDKLSLVKAVYNTNNPTAPRCWENTRNEK